MSTRFTKPFATMGCLTIVATATAGHGCSSDAKGGPDPSADAGSMMTNGTGGMSSGGAGDAAVPSSGGASGTGGLAGSGGAPTGSGGTDAGAPGESCVPNEQVACACPGGAEGVQVCNAAGTEYGPCEGCPEENAGSPCGDCDGCCHGDSCVPLASQSDARCGKKGETCEACGGGFVCAPGVGVCVVDSGTCSPASCPTGCCQGNVCLQPGDHDWNACGSGGEACTACDNYGVVCSAGSCMTDIADDALFFVNVVSTSVHERKADGANWDPFGGLPDLFVCAGDSPNSGCTEGSCSDSSSCSFDDLGVISDSNGDPVLFSGATLKAGLSVRVWDNDADANDLAGEGAIPISALEASYATGAFGQVDDVVIQIF